MNTHHWPDVWSRKGVLGIALSIIIPLSAVFAVLFFIKPDNGYMTLVFDAAFVVAVAGSVWYWAKRTGVTAKSIGLFIPSFQAGLGYFFYAVAGAVVVMIVGGGLSALLSKLLGVSAGNITPEMLVGPMWLVVLNLKLFAGLLIPFAEELLFRGVLFSYLRSRMVFIYAALVSTLLFSAVHFSAQMLPFTLMLGFASAFLFEKTRSLFPSIFLHIVVNTCAANMALLGLL